MKLEYPDKMKNNARSIANSQDWTNYIDEVCKTLKTKILHQGDHKCV
jgi:hypothetical protein